MTRELAGRHFSIVVCAEGAAPRGGNVATLGEEVAGQEIRLGGIAAKVAAGIEACTGKETRSLVLGQLQRGGMPTSSDRLLSLRYGAAAVPLAEEGRWGTMVAYEPPVMTAVPLEEAGAAGQYPAPHCRAVQTARDLGVVVGRPGVPACI